MITNSILLHISLIILIFLSTLTLVYLFKKISKTSTYLFQYKLKSKNLSLTLVAIYIILFFILLYILRMYTLKEVTDLSIPLNAILHFIHMLMDLQLIPRICLIILTFNLIWILIFIMANINKFFTHHILMLHIFYEGQEPAPGKAWAPYEKFVFSLTSYSDDDIISYNIWKILSRIAGYLYPKPNSKYSRADWDAIPTYHPIQIMTSILLNSYYKKAVIYSPFLLILDDCVFNDFQVRYLSHYMLFFVPLMLIKRLANAASHSNTLICKSFYNMYYKRKEVKGFFAIRPEWEPLLDMYLKNGLREEWDNGNFGSLLYLGSDFEWYNDDNIYYLNRFDTGVEITPEGKIIEAVRNDDDTEGYVEWILLFDYDYTKSKGNYHTYSQNTDGIDCLQNCKR